VNKKRKNILVWVFTWAGLLLAILYSPIGSPELYKSSDYYVANQNVDFNGGSIENAKNLNFESGNDYNELNIPDYNSEESSSKLSSGNHHYATTSNDYSSNATSYSSSESQSYQNLKNGSSGSNMGAGGGYFSSSSGSGGSSASSAVAMNSGGITTLSADLTMASASKIKNAGDPYKPGEGGQNPGGDPDPKTRIPIPDGWLFLLFLAASYGIIKKKFFMA
jgi:hypothetical protein